MSNTSAAELHTLLRDALALMPRMPVQQQLWCSADVAEYLRCSMRHATERIVCLPSFPPAVRINGGRPLWEAREVMEWALSHKETERAGRRRATFTA